ncbi:MAG: T9SS type A sorting domain-containing protein [Bacteroidales bacterium]|nr:T9SS type A sorting domain-containing protein [Bacteroidales bacterium]NPV37638.1 T9SS type A sorting domain-containing protein [Bacteroidales bacterium]
MKKILFGIIFTCIFFLPNYYFAQNVFTIQFQDTSDCNIAGLAEVQNGYYLFTTERPQNTGWYHRVRRLSVEGQVVLSMDISFEGKNATLMPAFLNDTGIWLVGITKPLGAFNCNVTVVYLDTALSQKWTTEFSNKHFNPWNTLATSGNNCFYYITDAFDNTLIDKNIFVYRFDLMGNLIAETVLGSSIYNEYLFSSTLNPSKDTIVITAGGFEYSIYPLKIVKIDNCLLSYNVSILPAYAFYYNNMEFISNYNILFSGRFQYVGSSPRDDDMAVMYLDEKFNIVKEKHYGATDTVDHPAYSKNISFIDPTRIFCGYNKNQDPYNIFSKNLSWFSLVLLNDSLEVQWEKFYGGDAYYGLWHVLATTDGGCLLAGTRYDWTTQNNERDAILIKVDENGLLTSTGHLPNLKAHDAIVYPNPGREMLTIESGPQIAGAVFVLFDMAGKTLLEHKLIHSTETISTTHLPSGLYLWNITLKGKTIENGKWIKE